MNWNRHSARGEKWSDRDTESIIRRLTKRKKSEQKGNDNICKGLLEHHRGEGSIIGKFKTRTCPAKPKGLGGRKWGTQPKNQTVLLERSRK